MTSRREKNLTSDGDKNVLIAIEPMDKEAIQRRRSSGYPTPKKTLKRDFDLVNTLIRKAVMNLRRNLVVLFFNIVSPAFQIILLSVAIGKEPKDLDVAVYNPERGTNVTRLENSAVNPFLRPFLPASINYDAEQFSNYSLMFLSTIDEEYINLVNYDNYEAAINSVKNCDTWAAITFPGNYSRYLNERLNSMMDPSSISNETMDGSSISFHGDFTEFPIQTTLMTSLMNSMQKYIAQIAESKGISDVDKLMRPLVVMTTVYGDPVVSPDFRDFMIPGFILGISFILAVGLTAISFVIEAERGTPGAKLRGRGSNRTTSWPLMS